MRKRNLSRFFMSMLAMCAITACSDNELGNDPNVNPGNSKDAVYMNVTVQLPTAGGSTRSDTTSDENDDYGESSSGTEIGQDYENEVKRVLLVLAKTKENGTENQIVAYGLNEKNHLSVAGSTAKSTHRIEKTTLTQYYGNDGTLNNNNNIKIYVFCNPTEELIDAVEKATNEKWVDNQATIKEDPTTGVLTEGDGDAIWGGKEHKAGFLMSTARNKDIIKQIPNNLSAWEEHTEPTKAFNLSGKNIYSDSDNNIDNSDNGEIRVERSVARFDFKDGSRNNNTYDVVKNDEGNTVIQIQLNRMGLVNMSKNFYYLRRVSDNGLNTTNTLCGTETSTNYVVDTDAEDKQKEMSSFNFGEHFNFCLGHVTDNIWTIDENARQQWYNMSIEDVTGNKSEDNDEGWNIEGGDNTGYHIWRYVTENTIPKPLSGKVAQRHGISTGIVFKGKMIATGQAAPELRKIINNEDGILKGDSDTDPILYAHGNNLFAKWTEVRQYAIKNKAEDEVFYKIVFGEPGVTPADNVYSNDTNSPDYLWKQWQNITDKTTEEAKTALKAFKTKATSEQFTLYQSSSDEKSGAGYYCYYYYWNRHNDNNKNGNMGPMEFAVVRNNVYKLAVTKIKQLGHPRISENDPDPEDPENPDESDEAYITLSVQVLPWVVRVNNIEF